MMGGVGASITKTFAYLEELNAENLFQTQGGEDSFHYDIKYQNQSVPSMNYTDYFVTDYILWINNGTETIPVYIIAESFQLVNNSGDIHHFSLDLYQDEDGSVISAWNQDWLQFTAIDWQSYANYYISQTQSEWTPYREEFVDPDNWENPGTGIEGEDPTTTVTEPWWVYESMGDEQQLENKSTAPAIWNNLYEGLESDEYLPSAYDQIPDLLTGDESWWFIDVFYEEWSNDYIYQTNYTWINVLTGELLDPTLDIYNAVEGYEGDWYLADSMRQNSTDVQLEGDWVWFSYSIDQWVAWSDPVIEPAGFAFSTFQYTGMSIFNDSNQNGILDMGYFTNPEWGQPTINALQSERLYDLFFTDISNFTYGVDVSTDQNLEVSITLEGITGIVQPTSSVYNVNPDFRAEELLPLTTYIPYLTVRFSLDLLSNGSSLSLKHDIGPFLSNITSTDPMDEFAGLSFTYEYVLDSLLYSTAIYVDKAIPSEYQSESSPITETLQLIASTPEEFSGFWNNNTDTTTGTEMEPSVSANTVKIMNFDFLAPYNGGPGNQTKTNTAVISPNLGFTHTPEIATPGMAAIYAAQVSTFYYSLCFPLWDGYALEMDPTLTSCFSFYRPLVKPFQLPNWVWSFLALPVIALFVLIMTKEEYRSFLLNRVLQFEPGPHRLSMEDVLENQNRSQVIDLIFEQPGIHYNELLRQSDLSPGNLTWHIEILERYKIIKSEILGKYVVYYPYYEFYEKNPLAYLDLTLAKSKTTMDILQLIQTTPALTQNEVAKRLEKDHKTIKYHLDKLIEANLITKRKIGKTNLLYPTIIENEE